MTPLDEMAALMEREASTGSSLAGGVRLWVARHAPAVDTAICYGRTDVAVHIAPEHAASRLLASYRGSPPRRIWSSPLSRCSLVADRLATMLNVPLIVDGALTELDFGRWEGRPWTAIQTDDREAYDTWLNGWEQVAPPGGERPAQIEARVRTWLQGLPVDGVDWVIAHSGVVRALSVVIERYTWPEAMRRNVPHLGWIGF